MKVQKKKSIQLPIVGRREQALLDQLSLIQEAGKRITVSSFCKQAGYANKSALRHFPVLKQALRAYVSRSGNHDNQQHPSTIRYLEVQIDRHTRNYSRLQEKVKQIPVLKAQIVALQKDLKKSDQEKRRLQGMISTLIAFLSGSDLAKARDLSDRLAKRANELLDD
jgi:hypothetical protein